MPVTSGTGLEAIRPRSRRASANGSGPGVGARSTSTGSAVRKLQRERRPGRALSSSARPGRSRNASAASIGRQRAPASSNADSRRSMAKRGALAALDDHRPMVPGRGQGPGAERSGRVGRQMGRAPDPREVRRPDRNELRMTNEVRKPRRPRPASRSGRRSGCPTRSTSRRSCGRAGSRAARAGRTRSATSARRSGSRR